MIFKNGRNLSVYSIPKIYATAAERIERSFHGSEPCVLPLNYAAETSVGFEPTAMQSRGCNPEPYHLATRP